MTLQELKAAHNEIQSLREEITSLLRCSSTLPILPPFSSYPFLPPTSPEAAAASSSALLTPGLLQQPRSFHAAMRNDLACLQQEITDLFLECGTLQWNPSTSPFSLRCSSTPSSSSLSSSSSSSSSAFSNSKLTSGIMTSVSDSSTAFLKNRDFPKENKASVANLRFSPTPFQNSSIPFHFPRSSLRSSVFKRPFQRIPPSTSRKVAVSTKKPLHLQTPEASRFAGEWRRQRRKIDVISESGKTTITTNKSSHVKTKPHRENPNLQGVKCMFSSFSSYSSHPHPSTPSNSSSPLSSPPHPPPHCCCSSRFSPSPLPLPSHSIIKEKSRARQPQTSKTIKSLSNSQPLRNAADRPTTTTTPRICPRLLRTIDRCDTLRAARSTSRSPSRNSSTSPPPPPLPPKICPRLVRAMDRFRSVARKSSSPSSSTHSSLSPPRPPLPPKVICPRFLRAMDRYDSLRARSAPPPSASSCHSSHLSSPSSSERFSRREASSSLCPCCHYDDLHVVPRRVHFSLPTSRSSTPLSSPSSFSSSFHLSRTHHHHHPENRSCFPSNESPRIDEIVNAHNGVGGGVEKNCQNDEFFVKTKEEDVQQQQSSGKKQMLTTSSSPPEEFSNIYSSVAASLLAESAAKRALDLWLEKQKAVNPLTLEEEAATSFSTSSVKYDKSIKNDLQLTRSITTIAKPSTSVDVVEPTSEKQITFSSIITTSTNKNSTTPLPPSLPPPPHRLLPPKNDLITPTPTTTTGDPLLHLLTQPPPSFRTNPVHYNFPMVSTSQSSPSCCRPFSSSIFVDMHDSFMSTEKEGKDDDDDGSQKQTVSRLSVVSQQIQFPSSSLSNHSFYSSRYPSSSLYKFAASDAAAAAAAVESSTSPLFSVTSPMLNFSYHSSIINDRTSPPPPSPPLLLTTSSVVSSSTSNLSNRNRTKFPLVFVDTRDAFTSTETEGKADMQPQTRRFNDKAIETDGISVVSQQIQVSSDSSPPPSPPPLLKSSSSPSFSAAVDSSTSPLLSLMSAEANNGGVDLKAATVISQRMEERSSAINNEDRLNSSISSGEDIYSLLSSPLSSSGESSSFTAAAASFPSTTTSDSSSLSSSLSHGEILLDSSNSSSLPSSDTSNETKKKNYRFLGEIEEEEVESGELKDSMTSGEVSELNVGSDSISFVIACCPSNVRSTTTLLGDRRSVSSSVSSSSVESRSRGGTSNSTRIKRIFSTPTTLSSHPILPSTTTTTTTRNRDGEEKTTNKDACGRVGALRRRRRSTAMKTAESNTYKNINNNLCSKSFIYSRCQMMKKSYENVNILFSSSSSSSSGEI